MPLSDDAKAHLEQLRIHAAIDQQVVIGVAIDTNTGEMTRISTSPLTDQQFYEMFSQVLSDMTPIQPHKIHLVEAHEA
jgi:hypothetical protein